MSTDFAHGAQPAAPPVTASVTWRTTTAAFAIAALDVVVGLHPAWAIAAVVALA